MASLKHKIKRIPLSSRKKILFAAGAFIVLAVVFSYSIWHTKIESKPSILGEEIGKSFQNVDSNNFSIDEFKKSLDSTNQEEQQAKNEQFQMEYFLKTAGENEVVYSKDQIQGNVSVKLEKVRFSKGVTIAWFTISNFTQNDINLDFSTNALLSQKERELKAGKLYDENLALELSDKGTELFQVKKMDPQSVLVGFLLFENIDQKQDFKLVLSNFINSQTKDSWDYIYNIEAQKQQ